MSNDLEKDLDEVAQDKYGAAFKDLSAFAKADCLNQAFILHKGIGAAEVDLVRGMAIANEKVSKLERENRDLWHENEELKIENLELTDELNKYSSGRSARN